MRRCHSTHSPYFRGSSGVARGSAAVRVPNPPRPFARSRLFMCFPFFWGKREIPRKSQEKAGRVPGQCRDNPGDDPVCLFIGFLLALVLQEGLGWHVCRTKLSPEKNIKIDTERGLKNAKKKDPKNDPKHDRIIV